MCVRVCVVLPIDVKRDGQTFVLEVEGLKAFFLEAQRKCNLKSWIALFDSAVFFSPVSLLTQ